MDASTILSIKPGCLSRSGGCARWTIFAWYSPMQANMTDADDFLDRIKELKPWLR